MSNKDTLLEEIKQLLQDFKARLDQKDCSSRKTEIISNSELLKMLNVSRRTANQWRADGLLPYFKIGHKVFYHLHEVNEFVLKHKAEPNDSVR